MPIPPVYDPQEVIDTIVGLATKPQDEVQVGTAGTVTTVFHNLFPGLTEKMMKKQTSAAFENADPVGDTEGSLRAPVEHGTGVTGGWLKK